MKNLPSPQKTFTLKKEKILSALAVPDTEYTDASPKGSVDAGIRQLIEQVNAHAGLVTTSSCAGRVSVYLEGRKAGVAGGGGGSGGREGELAAAAGGEGVDGDEVDGGVVREGNAGAGGSVAAAASAVGGKGGGEWLFVSHDPVVEVASDEGYERLMLGTASEARDEVAARQAELEGGSRLIHFKFEPMILHVLTASLEHAQLVIQAGMEAGFRETGAVSLLKRQPDEEATPMVAVRSMGLSFESLIGAETDGMRQLIVSPQYLKTLVKIANERFVENEKRIARFGAALEAAFAPPKAKEGWEDAEARRERKRQEGLRRRAELEKEKNKPAEGSADEPDIDLTLQQQGVI